MIADLQAGCLMMLQPFTATAVEVLSVRELATHCALLASEPDGVDGQYCIRDIQGFIDAAVATDTRVMLKAESALERDKTFTERAMRTRARNLMERSRAPKLPGSGLGDLVPLRDVVDVFLANRAALPDDAGTDEPSMEASYTSLQQHDCCEL